MKYVPFASSFVDVLCGSVDRLIFMSFGIVYFLFSPFIGYAGVKSFVKVKVLVVCFCV